MRVPLWKSDRNQIDLKTYNHMKQYIYILFGCGTMYGISNLATALEERRDAAVEQSEVAIDSPDLSSARSSDLSSARSPQGLVSVAYAGGVEGESSSEKSDVLANNSGTLRATSDIKENTAENVKGNVKVDVKADTKVDARADVKVKEVTIDREVFAYSGAHRRDPFVSLLTTNDLRPLISEVRITTIAYDSEGRSSVAILRNIESGEQYRLQTGDNLGRMRVVRIDPKSVTFALDEFGYSRRETLVLSDSKEKRN